MAQDLVKKLQIKSGQRMIIINAPEGYLDELGVLPEGAELLAKPEGTIDFGHLFVSDAAELEKLLLDASKSIKHDGIFWISYPKQSSKVKTDLNRDILRELLDKSGLRTVSMISIDDTWSAMRVRPN